MTIRNLVLIGGGTGFIGRHLGDHLIRRGYEVVNVSRRLAINNVNWEVLANEGLPDRTKIVINLTGQNALDFKKRWTPKFKEEVFNSRVDSAKCFSHLINKAKYKPNLFINLSGVSCYKPDDKVEYSEDAKVEPYDYFSNLCIEWERAAKIDSPSCRQANIRCGVVLASNGGIIKDMYLPFSLGLGAELGPGSQYFPWIHIDDLIRVFDFMIENCRVQDVCNAVAPEQVVNWEFTRKFATNLNRSVFLKIPESFLNAFLSKERAALITTGPRVVPKRLLDAGFKFCYPTLNSALSAIVETRF